MGGRGGEGSGASGELALKDTKEADMLDLQLPLKKVSQFC